MILLIGGTSETAPLALALAQVGFKVLVSTATDLTLDVGSHPNLSRRVGKLDRAGMYRLASENGIKLIVDAAHPYATSARANARKTAMELNIPYLGWLRPAVLEPHEWVIFRENHEPAAEVACSFGVPLLLTTGSTNLAPYVAAADRSGVELVVRVLAHPDSLEASRKAGVRESNIVTGRGPFSVDENLAVMRRFSIGVLVTKDSGVAGGVPAKLEAARILGCRVVVVQRPKESAGSMFFDVSKLVAAACEAVSL